MAKNENFVIADAGGTSTTWLLCSAADVPESYVYGSGINATVQCAQSVADSVAQAITLLREADRVYFYGAGCKGDSNIAKVSDAIKAINPSAEIEIHSDLLGAARALFGKSSGIACILGTGSNSCVINGGDIVMNTPPLGYLIGDEGSGASLGRRLLREVLRGNLTDSEIIADIEHIAGGKIENIVSEVYSSASPNKYLSQFAPVLSKHIQNTDIQNIVTSELKCFFNSCIRPYKDSGFKQIGFIGSVAEAFQDIIKNLCKEEDLAFTKVIKNPMEGLINYHQNYK